MTLTVVVGPAKASAARTAASAASKPGPQIAVLQLDPARNAFAVDTRIERTCAAVKFGATSSINDTTPDTIGAAKLVPPTLATVSKVGVVAPAFESVNTPSIEKRRLY